MIKEKQTHVIVLVIKGVNADGSFKQIIRRFVFGVGLTFEEINDRIGKQLQVSDRFEVVNIFEY